MRQAFIIVPILIIVLIIGITMFSGHQEETVTPQAVEVEVYEGKVQVSNDKVQKTITPGEVFTAPTLEEKRETAIVSADEKISSATKFDEVLQKIESQPKALQILVTDALGDPIQKGSIKINDENFSFKHGRAVIQDTIQNPVTIAANANGYFSVSKTIEDISTDDPVELVMEYKCSIDVEVHTKNKQTMAGAEVTLYRGLEVDRPVPEKAQIHYNYVNVDFEQAAVQYKDDGIHVLQTSEKKLQIPPYNQVSGLTPGDIILGIDYCMWNPGDTRHVLGHNTPRGNKPGKLSSPRLRIWDTIVLQNQQSGWGFGPSLEFSRDGQRYCSRLRKLSFAENEPALSTQQTDSLGRCTFNNLKPGLYFIQARKDDFHSRIVPVFPTMDNVQLRMSDSSRLYIRVNRETNEGADDLFNCLPGAQVVLQPSTNNTRKGIFAHKTDKYGRCKIEKVPYGKYHITATAPTDAKGKTVSQEFEVREPFHHIELSIPDTGYTISGHVLTYEDRQPVADYTLELDYRGVTVPGDTGWGINDAGRIKTDANGYFEFNNLKLGTYDICAVQAEIDKYCPAFIPEDQYDKGTYTLKTRNKDMAVIDIKDHDINNVEIYVVSSVKTTISGIVTDQNNVPVHDAVIQVDFNFNNKDIIPKFDEEYLNLSQGRFEFSFYGRPSEHEKSLDITASKGKVIPEQWDNHSVQKEHVDVEAQAVERVNFMMGDHIKDLHLVLEGVKKFTVTGHVKMVDGSVVKRGNIHLRQRNDRNEYTLNEDGSFEIHGVQPGSFYISVHDEYHHVQHERFGERPYYDYRYASKPLEMPEDGNLEPVELIVEPAGHLAGILLDENNQPYSGAVLLPKNSKGQSYMDMQSDEMGYFWLYGLPLDETFSIHVFYPGEKEPAVIMENLTPPNENIIIQLE